MGQGRGRETEVSPEQGKLSSAQNNLHATWAHLGWVDLFWIPTFLSSETSLCFLRVKSIGGCGAFYLFTNCLDFRSIYIVVVVQWDFHNKQAKSLYVV